VSEAFDPRGECVLAKRSLVSSACGGLQNEKKPEKREGVAWKKNVSDHEEVNAG